MGEVQQTRPHTLQEVRASVIPQIQEKVCELRLPRPKVEELQLDKPQEKMTYVNMKAAVQYFRRG
jgi:hypothetical protein